VILMSPALALASFTVPKRSILHLASLSVKPMRSIDS
jgi:hypothetical protein